MNRAQIQEIERLSDSIGKSVLAAERKRIQLRKILNVCDHFYANNRSAVKRLSTHDAMSCGGYHECAVCAGEQVETYANVCRICKKIVSGAS